ncbi:P-loop containing nucleoside triphosphate hydrolase [Trinorchestia longiramus]|nr:P-loop containing nucleoside triphosphate hydrolase [Trinorchestia longiramus]
MLEVMQPPQLKSPKMVAAVASSCYQFKPSRNVVKQRKEMFERGFSDSCLLVKSCKIHRGRSADSFRSKPLNEAQRLVKYRSSSSLASLDSGLSSRGGSTNTSSEDLQGSVSRSPSNDRLKLRRNIRVSTSFTLPRSSLPKQSPSLAEEPRNCDLISKSATSTPDLCLPDLLTSQPPPLPPKSRPPLPPRRRIESPNHFPIHQSTTYGDADSEGSSELSFPDFCEYERNQVHFSTSLKGTIPHTFMFKDSVRRFLLDVGHTACSDVFIEDLSVDSSGRFSVTAATSVRPEERTEVQVLFRTGGLARLEEQRDAVLAGTITRLQAHARGVLARRRLQKRKVQETAIRCIQKNVRKFMGVREWPWWRLLVRLTPLLDVHRTEHQLREAKTELETLKARLEKVEKEKTNLQQANDMLEGRSGGSLVTGMEPLCKKVENSDEELLFRQQCSAVLLSPPSLWGKILEDAGRALTGCVKCKLVTRGTASCQVSGLSECGVTSSAPLTSTPPLAGTGISTIAALPSIHSIPWKYYGI